MGGENADSDEMRKHTRRSAESQVRESEQEQTPLDCPRTATGMARGAQRARGRLALRVFSAAHLMMDLSEVP